MKPYLGSKNFSDLGITKPQDSNWDRACKEADEAIDKSDEERLKLVIELLPSDEENSQAEDTPTPKTRRQSKGPPPKRRRLLAPAEDSDDGSADEYKPEPVSESEVEDSLMEEAEEEIVEEEKEESETETPVKGKKRKLPPSKTPVSGTPAHLKSFSSFDSPSISQSTKKKLSEFTCKDVDGVVCDSQNEGRSFNHLSYEFLKPDKIRDAQRRRPDDPDYDPHTLYVPDNFKQNLTPAMRQWWEMKVRRNYYFFIIQLINFVLLTLLGQAFRYCFILQNGKILRALSHRCCDGSEGVRNHFDERR